MPENNTRELTIRMYNQGLGDCFLLTFPGNEKPFHILIDCGALDSKHYDKNNIIAVVKDIKEQTGGRLDAVVATHEHWDHISGFTQAKEVFDQITVDKVWTAWTDEPGNPIAQEFKEKFKKSKKAVKKAISLIPDDKKNHQLGLYKKAITELFNFSDGIKLKSENDEVETEEEKKGRTEVAWENFLGLSKTKVYCNPKKMPLELDGVADVRAYILGPPDSADYIKKKLSTKETYDTGKHSFSAFSSFIAAFMDDDDNDREVKMRSQPFDERFRVKPDDARNKIFFQNNYGFAETDKGLEWRRITYDWLAQAGELALHLDSYTNNTCLAMAIELGESGKVLLFPGDAQVGNWLSWNDLSWKIKNKDGSLREVKIDDLLAQTVFYKVGHHGSHNATMRAKGLEKMTNSELVAMIPVHRKTAQDQAWEFPYAPLWTRLRERACGRVLLADAKNLDEISAEAQALLTNDQWQKFESATKFNDLCIEFKISY